MGRKLEESRSLGFVLVAFGEGIAMRGNVGLSARASRSMCSMLLPSPVLRYSNSSVPHQWLPSIWGQRFLLPNALPKSSFVSFGHFGPKPVFFKRRSSFLLRGRNDMLDDSQITGDQWETCPRLHLIWWSGQDR